MPTETELTQAEINTFDDIRKYFIAHPDPACIPLLLGSFADDMGLGVYQLCDDVFKKFDWNVVVPHLASAMKSAHKGVRWWAAHWAMEFPAIELFFPLQELIGQPGELDAHIFATLAICFIYISTKDKTVTKYLRDRLVLEGDQELKAEIATCLKGDSDA